MNVRDKSRSRPRVVDERLVRNRRRNWEPSTSNNYGPGHVGDRSHYYNEPDYFAANNHGFVHHQSSNPGGGVVGPSRSRSTYTAEGVKRRRTTLGISDNQLEHFGASAGPSPPSAAPVTRCRSDYSRSASMGSSAPWHRPPTGVGLHDVGSSHRGQSYRPSTTLNRHSFSNNAGSLPRHPQRLTNPPQSADFLRSPPVAPQHRILRSSQGVRRGVCYPNAGRQRRVLPTSQDNSAPANQLMQGNRRIYGRRNHNVSVAASRPHESQGSSGPANRPISNNGIYQSRRRNHAPVHLAVLSFELVYIRPMPFSSYME